MDVPIYVTRPDKNGDVGEFCVNDIVLVLIYVLSILNAVGWGVYGIFALIEKLV